jgi:hypothetical protein
MLSETDVEILVLLRGLHFAATALKVPRADLLKIAVSGNSFNFYSNVRREILQLSSEKGRKHVIEVFGIDYTSLTVLRLFNDPKLQLKWEKEKLKRQKLSEEGKEGEGFVTQSSFLKSFGKKRRKSMIVDRITAMSKEFLVQEAEKTGDRFGICEKYDVDRVTLIGWTASFQKTGVLKSSHRRYREASELLKRAIQEVENDPEYIDDGE